MATELLSLFAKIGIDDKEYTKGVDGATKKTKPLDEAIKKVGTSSETLNNKMKVLAKQHEDAAKKVADLEKEFNKSVNATGADSKETQELADKLKKAEKEVNDIDKEMSQYIKTEDKYEEETEDAEKSTKKLSDGLKKGLKTGLKIAGAALAAATTAIIAFSKKSIETGMDFDSAMSQVAATMGKTNEEMQSEVGEVDLAWGHFSGNLREYAREMGAHTAFSATQAADALNILAMAGYETQDAMNTLPGVLNLAAAGGLEIADAADYATGIIAGFGLEVEDAGHVADALATIASNAKGSVSSFGEGLSAVAGIARSTGQNMDDMAVALGILGNNNFAAAEGGNALNRTLRNLYQATDTGQKALDELGVSAYDAATGKARPLQEVLIDLNSALDGMNDQAKNQALSQIFDAATLKAVPALLNNATDSWDELDNAIKSSAGAAEKMANVQLDNLAGDITLFKSALADVQIGISDGLNPTLRDFVQTGTKGLETITEGIKEGGLVGGIEAIGTVLSNVVNKIVEYAPQVVEGGIALLQALIDGLLSEENVPLIVDTVMQIAMLIVNAISTAAPQILSAGIMIIFALIQGITENIPMLIPAVIQVVTELATMLTEPDMLMNLINAALELILALTDGLIEALPVLMDAIPVIIQNLITAIIRMAPQLSTAALQLIIKLAGGLILYYGKIIEAVVNIGKKVRDKVKDMISRGPKQWGRDMLDTFVSGIKERIGKITDTVKGVANTIKSYLHFSVPDIGPLADADTWMPDFMDLLSSGIDTNKFKVTNAIDDLAGDMMLGGDYGDIYETSEDTQRFEFTFAEGNAPLLQIARLLFPYMQVVSKEKGAV